MLSHHELTGPEEKAAEQLADLEVACINSLPNKISPLNLAEHKLNKEESTSLPLFKTPATVNATLVSAVHHNNRALLKKLCQQDGADVNGVDKNNNTPLHHAIARNNDWAVRFLLAEGAKTDLKNNKNQTANELGNTRYGKFWKIWKIEYSGLGFFAHRKKPAPIPRYLPVLPGFKTKIGS